MKPIFIILIFSVILIIGCAPSTPAVCINKTCFNVEVVSTPETRAIGLMFREQMDNDNGMLFVFEKEDIYYFWMKNTLIPLDMIWMNKDKEIIYINKNTPPCKHDPCLSYGPNEDSLYVLEINGGLTDTLGINVGDTFEFKSIITS